VYQKINRNRSHFIMGQTKTDNLRGNVLINSLIRIDNFLPKTGDQELVKNILAGLTSSSK